ncbi:hypothetical protein GUITHDRAFT_151329 [Guillardia theta CCMP2712]|uniref:Uncharacterized protein n=1 Tax=Guillardia theta (strain CCMP2712) TaxID=905079 RepID=L1JNR1_GUITC|nr:hypothetical protein GUITHDRAFT_151329 [Guillardia theta CCMP2712]EKX49914.1 hypothetical protein GUITHDRAFT_151329 [Guillardia theta CCMP2712]|eukprot:XP_005836894.1 hypothetical protein GUITHDRAFT_151329 [Guillardia theta CCMP2712]
MHASRRKGNQNNVRALSGNIDTDFYSTAAFNANNRTQQTQILTPTFRLSKPYSPT